MQTESLGTHVTNFFSLISKIERSTRITSEYAYRVSLDGIRSEDIAGFTGLLLAERVEQYEGGLWREVDITRDEHSIRDAGENGYSLSFEITRKELPNSSSVYQKSLRLYIGDTLCDMDDAEIVPINKQVNDIAEMQDRNSDFTASFKVRKTRAMRELFEMSGEVGAQTNFPYERQSCRLVQDNIEVITGGILTLLKRDDEYYHVSILSGNVTFFKRIETLKITDLSLPSMVHTWDVPTMVSSHANTSPAPDVIYPLLEPSDDGGMTPLTDTGDRVDLWAQWIWPFCKVKVIWDEIFANSGFTVTGGEVLDSDVVDKLYMPISSLSITNTKDYHYSIRWNGVHPMAGNETLAFPGAVMIKGDATFQLGFYICRYSATYSFHVKIINGSILGGSPAPTIYLFKWLNTLVATFNLTFSLFVTHEYDIEYTAVAGDILYVMSTPVDDIHLYSIAITKIEGATIALGSLVDPRLHLPDMSQTEFVKMICNLFGLIPDVNARDRTIRFWNYQELYDNVPIARDWSKFLSERDDEVEFKFGDYAQKNLMHYKDSEDVQEDRGRGEMPVEDETLPEEKDMVQLNVSTADEVRILTTNFAVDIARIALNKWSDSDNMYKPASKIDARIVYIDRVRSIASPPYEKTLGITYTDPVYGVQTTDILSPLKASTTPISFSNLIVYYANVSRLLTKTKLRRAKFNLPVYEVAGLKHNVPVYLSQYKAYFYVNKINNYVAGKLCTIDLIKL